MKMENHKTKGMAGTRNYQGLNLTLIQTLRQKIEALRESEEKFEIIFESIPDGILLADISTMKFSIGNKAILHMLGYTMDEIKKMSVNDIHPKKDLPYVISQFEKQARREIGIALGLPVKRKDGSVFYADINSFPLILNGKKYLAGAFRDVTELKKAEDALKESEEKYRTIVDSATDMIFLLDTKLRFVSINLAAANILRKSPEELVGKSSIFDVFPKETAIRFAKNNKQVIETGKSKFIEEKMVVNGKEFYNDTSLNPIKDSKGNVVAVMGITRDITKEKMAERHIHEGEEKYQALFESSSDAIMTLAPPTWKFTEGNPSAINMFKAKNGKDFASRAPWEFSPKYQLDGKLSSVKAKEMIGKAMKTGRNFFEWTHRRLNGEDFLATVLLTRLEIGGKKLLQATVRDITAEKNRR
jgi:PAS domain S-box-containing protein